MNNDYDKMKNPIDDKKSSGNFNDVLNLVDATKNIKLNEDYRISVISNFRKNLEKKSLSSERFSIKHSFALIVFIAAGYLLTSNLLNNNMDSIESALTDLDEEEINLIVDDYDLSIPLQINDSDVNTQTIDSIYSKSMYSAVNEYINTEGSASYTSDYEINDVENLLSDDEVDQLYSQLLEKEIL